MSKLVGLLRGVLRFRLALAMSLLCSLFVGLLWGANIGTLYPILQVVFEGESLHQSIDRRMNDRAEACRQLEAEIAALKAEPAAHAGADTVAVGPDLRWHEARLAAEQRGLALLRSCAATLHRCLPTGPFATLVLVMAIMFAATILRGVFLAINEIIVAGLTQRLVFDLRSKFYRHSLRLDVDKLTADRTSCLVSRCTHDIAQVNEGLSAVLGQGVREPLKIVVCLAGAALVSWRLLILTLLAIPPAVLLIRRMSQSLKRASHSDMSDMSQLYAQLEQSFSAIKLVKTFGTEPAERRRFYQICKGILRRILRASAIRATIRPTTETFTVAAVSLVVLAGAYLVIHQQTHLLGVAITSRPLTPANLLLLYALLLGAAEPLKRLSDVAGRVHRSIVALERIDLTLQSRPTITSPANPVSLPPAIKELHFNHVHFRYSRKHRVLNDVDLMFNAGELLALVGPNGCGKSTLINLIPRLYDPSRGAIRVHGVDLREVRLRDLRKRIAIVPQETLLFDETVLDNIRYSFRHATESQVIEAARLSDAHEFITTRLEKGYQTVIGERGNFLSGGQRQRLSLARALLRNADVLILDEATSEIDAVSERKIFQAIKDARRDRITIFVAHGSALLDLADRIVVLEEGQVRADGTHAEVLATSRYYQYLWTRNSAQAA